MDVRNVAHKLCLIFAMILILGVFVTQVTFPLLSAKSTLACYASLGLTALIGYVGIPLIFKQVVSIISTLTGETEEQ